MEYPMKLFTLATALAVVILAGCQQEPQPVQVGKMNEYRDPAFGFQMHYPEEWRQLGTVGRALFTRSQEVASKFIDPSSGEEGAQVSVEVIPLEGRTPDEIVASSKQELSQIAKLNTDEPITVAGRQATKVPFTIPVTSKTNIQGYEVFVPGDTAIYKLDFVGYGKQYELHQAVFDTMLHTFRLPVVVAKRPDVWQASSNLETLNSPFFTAQYPDNLEFVSVPKGDRDYVVQLQSPDRRDCSIRIDVFGAKGLTVDKVWDQNKGRYKARATGQTTIDGQTAYWVDYTPMANISSRAYFVVKNDKVIRPTLNWFQPQRDVYFPVFEGIVKSIKLK
jgi:hypothetical protein